VADHRAAALVRQVAAEAVARLSQLFGFSSATLRRSGGSPRNVLSGVQYELRAGVDW
jgi:hypothetical protein